MDNHPKVDAEDGETLATYVMYAEALEQAAQYAAANGIYLKLTPLVKNVTVGAILLDAGEGWLDDVELKVLD